ncbi:ATP-dependent Clp protease adaptor ClpS [Maribellus sediminis]|uniref:ATP-dependent Clp protease adaptor ClpS n=1 Tax=Maribellus sediminis TaxID=2696285 RepID=UPI0014303E80|nr:ATP-dependent Clp protease adaptor ClpS [Maribellus sediminis]
MTIKEPKNIPSKDSNEKVKEENFLMLHNDDVHTFDYVIDALIEICEHNFEQATQCTYLVHYKGKCDVKKGSFTDLKPLKDALIDRELNATID